MNIIREHLDELNAVVKVNIAKEDYEDKVQKILTDYRKSANIPGFRKGHVPMGMVKKQYGKAVLVDEVIKLLRDALGKYLIEEKLDVLGIPLPKPQDNLDWDADSFSFEFELGLAPNFEINLKSKKPIIHYHIYADEKMINEHILQFQKQYGKLIPQTEINEDSEITGTFVNLEENIESKATFLLDKIKGKANTKKFIGSKVGDKLALKTKNLFNEEAYLATYLKMPLTDIENLNINLQFEVSEINKRELADLDQELFDKLYGADAINTVTELKERIKTDSEKEFEKQSDQKLLNDVTEYLINNTKFNLPSAFLQKWMQTSGKELLTEQQAAEEFEKSEKSMRYQLIESKIIEKYNLQIQLNELKEFSKSLIKLQMAQFGMQDTSNKELEDIADRILSNKEEATRLSEQLLSNKLLKLYKQEANIKTKKISYNNFVKEVYK